LSAGTCGTRTLDNFTERRFSTGYRMRERIRMAASVVKTTAIAASTTIT
jgi:hypothetical protein